MSDKSNPNYPSKTGNPSGKGRGNTPKNKVSMASKGSDSSKGSSPCNKGKGGSPKKN